MATPSVTLKSLKNEGTGIDISVPRFKEEEAPLGGISILYEINVLTRLDLFKTRLHKSGDIVQFTLFKAYREIEDLYSKLNKKYPKAGLPPVPKTSTASKYSDDDKLEALDQFMSAIAKNVEICYSSTFTQFIGINSQRMPSFSVPIDPNGTSDKKEVPESDKDSPSEVFPKVKSSVVKNQSAAIQKRNADLFEEVKLISSASSMNDKVKKSSQGLFDDFEDENLFSSKPVEKAPPVVKEQKKIEKPVETKKQPKKLKGQNSSIQKVDDSQIIIKDRKQGEVSLFNEQDLGDYITREEEDLFLVTSPTTGNKKNSLLVKENEILSPQEDKKCDHMKGSDKEKRIRKRVPNPETWKSNIRKKLCQEGKEYISIRGKKVPEKKIQIRKDCLQLCKFKCNSKVSSEEQRKFHDAYYSLNANEKRHFLVLTSERTLTARPKKITEGGKSSKRKFSFKYFFFLRGKKIQVCKQFYLGTLSISQKPVYTAHEQKDKITNLPQEDKRGKSKNSRRKPRGIPDLFREHVKSFYES